MSEVTRWAKQVAKYKAKLAAFEPEPSPCSHVDKLKSRLLRIDIESSIAKCERNEANALLAEAKAEREMWLTVLTEQGRQWLRCTQSDKCDHTCKRCGMDLLALLGDLDDG